MGAFFDAILQAESDSRTERKTKRRMKAAKFAVRPSPTFQDFDFTANRSISKALIKDLYSLQWLADARPVLLIGQTGVGKMLIRPGSWPTGLRERQVGPVYDLDHLA